MLNFDVFKARQSSIVPETSVPDPSLVELTMRVTVLANEVARLSRELSTLRQSIGTSQVSTVGPLPASVADIASGRAGMRYIAHVTGRNEDTIRGILSRGKEFAELRAKSPDLTTNIPVVKWLAGTVGDMTRFELIHSGAASAQELAEMGARS